MKMICTIAAGFVLIIGGASATPPPTGTVYRTVQVDTNGVLVNAGTNLISANGIATTGSVAQAIATRQEQLFTIADSFLWSTNGGGLVIGGYTGTNTAVSIPPQIGGIPVVTIGVGAFDRDAWNTTNLVSVTIPDSVLSIEANAFDSCTMLSNVIFGESLATIGQDAFLDCSNLTSIVLGSNLLSISNTAFAGALKLKAVYFKGNAPVLGIDTFDLLVEGTNYYLSGMSGFSTNFGGWPTDIWGPRVMPLDGSIPASGGGWSGILTNIVGTVTQLVYHGAYGNVTNVTTLP